MDKLGSKPLLTFACSLWLAISVGWILLAGRVLTANTGLILPLQFLMGIGAALVNMANIRLAMAICPEMGRNHFFALFSVVANLTLGLAPVLWGLAIDALTTLDVTWHGFSWNRYTIFFLGAGIMFGVTLFLTLRLEEPSAARVERLIKEILVLSPQKVWARVWPKA